MIYKCECGQVHDNGISRRDFLGLSAGAVFGYALTQFAHPIEVAAQSGYRPRNTAEFCILINMNGGPSQCDMFDVKTNGDSRIRIRPDDWERRMDIQSVPDASFKLPMGLLRELAPHASKMVPVRWYGWSDAHEIGQYWNYTNMDNNPAFQAERPNVGAIVASEFARTGRRRPDDVLPGFVSLSGLPYQNGFLSGEYAPFIVGANPNGLGNILDHPADGGRSRFDQRWSLLQTLDGANRSGSSPLGTDIDNFYKFYTTTKRMMYNPDVTETFKFTLTEAKRYAARPDVNPNGTGFGNSLIVARNLVRANKGTRFVWITTGGWDMHDNIYESLFDRPQANNGTGRQFSAALGALLTDLKSYPSVRNPSDRTRSLLDDTLIVINGDFGRTPAKSYNPERPTATGLNGTRGRDHWRQSGFTLFIGGGVRGGRAIGQTDESSHSITDPGWNAFDGRSRRPRTLGGFPNAGPVVRTEDCYFTMYSALGIDPATIYRETPSGRPYQLVYGGVDMFGELPLWS